MFNPQHKIFYSLRHTNESARLYANQYGTTTCLVAEEKNEIAYYIVRQVHITKCDVMSSVHIYCTNLQACQSDYERERDREATREDIPAFSCFKKMCSNVSLVLVTLDSHTTQHTLGSLLLLQLLCYPYHYVV